MQKFGIMGGTFDPIHNGHLMIAKAALEEYQLDKIFFIPAAHPPHKTNITPALDRLTMVQIATATNPSFEVLDIELKRQGPSYTVDTLKELHRIHPLANFYFIIGADCLETLHTWNRIDEIIHLCTFLVSKRPHYISTNSNVATIFPQLRLEFLQTPELEISSTAIRTKIQQGVSTDKIMPSAVRNYINKQKLYL